MADILIFMQLFSSSETELFLGRSHVGSPFTNDEQKKIGSRRIYFYHTWRPCSLRHRRGKNTIAHGLVFTTWKKKKKKKLRVFVLGFLLIPFLLIGSVMLLPFWSPFQANENLLYWTMRTNFKYVNVAWLYFVLLHTRDPMHALHSAHVFTLQMVTLIHLTFKIVKT